MENGIGNSVSTILIDRCNWPEEYPSKPQVKLSMAHDSEVLYFEFEVHEECSRAQARDMGHVWEDSCVEMFISPCPEDGIYYNFECNCIGSLLLCAGKGRHERISAPPEVLSKVHRFSSLLPELFELKHVDEWKVALVIPREAFFMHDIKSFDGLKIKANFYKCGDMLPTPHFLSYAPIKTPSPDFHRPEFFASFVLR